MGKVVKKPTEVFEEQLNSLFDRKSKTDIELLFQVISLILYENLNNTDLLDLYKVLPLDEFLKVVTVFDNRNVSFPSKKEIKEALTLAVCYYYKEIEHLEWEDIKKIIPFEISSISYGIKIRNMNKSLSRQIQDLFYTMED